MKRKCKTKSFCCWILISTWSSGMEQTAKTGCKKTTMRIQTTHTLLSCSIRLNKTLATLWRVDSQCLTFTECIQDIQRRGTWRAEWIQRRKLKMRTRSQMIATWKGSCIIWLRLWLGKLDSVWYFIFCFKSTLSFCFGLTWSLKWTNSFNHQVFLILYRCLKLKMKKWR